MARFPLNNGSTTFSRQKPRATDVLLRRQFRDVDRYIGRERLAHELARRGYHAVENAGQIVIFCNREPIRRFH